MYIVLLGAPGAGKGTQAMMLAEEIQLVHVASGDLFRKAMQQATELGRKAKSYIDKGQLVPDEVTIQMVLERLAQPDCKGGVILDGFPRTIEQAKALDKALAGQSKAIDKVVNIKVTEEKVIKRLGGRWICRNCQAPYHEANSRPAVKRECKRCGGELYQRDDDKPETVKNRLKVYEKQTAPLIEYYKKAGKLVEVDGDGGLKAVHKRVMAALS